MIIKPLFKQRCIKSYFELPRSLWAVSFMSFFWSTSSFMVFGLLPSFLIDVLHASKKQLGVMEGIAIFSAFLAKLCSGILSDIYKNRKFFIIIGTLGSVVVKILFVFSTQVGHVFFARSFDRFLKGIRAAPTDALIGDLASLRPEEKGSTKRLGSFFGLRQTFYSFGNVVGGGVATFIMIMSENNYRLVFLCSIIPASLAFIILVFAVNEPSHISSSASDGKIQEHPTDAKKKKVFISFKKDMFKNFSASFWGLIFIAFVLYLSARFSNFFLNLRGKECGISTSFLPLLFSMFELTWSLSSFPLGLLSDRIGKKKMFFCGIVVLLITNIILYKASSAGFVILGIFLWGIHLGMTEGILSALVLQHASPSLKGTAFGLFYLVTGIAILLSNSFFGFFSDMYGNTSIVFLVSSFLLAFILLPVLTFQLKKKLNFK